MGIFQLRIDSEKLEQYTVQRSIQILLKSTQKHEGDGQTDDGYLLVTVK